MQATPATLSATIDLPPAARSVPAARRVLAELLTTWAAERYRDDASLLVSELVTNVVRHVAGGSNMVLEVHLSEPGLRICVVDASATRPTRREPGAGEPGGHGMRLVAAVADRWGSEAHQSGKRVWFELRDADPAGVGTA
ncbi:MAG: ATP-binding protein [Pseudonocardia sp.]|nr:ATP-binding protein [Pseudonocardia sp.]